MTQEKMSYDILAEKLGTLFSEKRFHRAVDVMDLYLTCAHYKIYIPRLHERLALKNIQLLDSEYPFTEDGTEALSIAWGRLRNASETLPDFSKVYTMLEAFIFCVRNDGELGNKPTAKEWNEDGIALWGESSNG